MPRHEVLTALRADKTFAKTCSNTHSPNNIAQTFNRQNIRQTKIPNTFSKIIPQTFRRQNIRPNILQQVLPNI